MPRFLLVCLLLAGCGSSSANLARTQAATHLAVREADEVSLRKDVVPMLESRCAHCHAAWVTSDGKPNYARIKRDAKNILLRIERRNMPKDKPGSVTEAELAALKAWIDAGTPDN